MTPRKKNKGVVSNNLTTPAEDKSNLCPDASESTCESCSKSTNDKNSTC